MDTSQERTERHEGFITIAADGEEEFTRFLSQLFAALHFRLSHYFIPQADEKHSNLLVAALWRTGEEVPFVDYSLVHKYVIELMGKVKPNSGFLEALAALDVDLKVLPVKIEPAEN